MPNPAPKNFLEAPSFVFPPAIGLCIEKQSNSHKAVDLIRGA
jgi:hypothetical protein